MLPAAGSAAAASVAAGVAALGAVCYFVYKAQWQASPTSSYQFPFLAFTSIERQQQLVNETKGSDSHQTKLHIKAEKQTQIIRKLPIDEFPGARFFSFTDANSIASDSQSHPDEKYR